MKLMWIRWWLFGVEPTRDEILKYCMMLIEPEKLELIPLIQPGARMEVLDAPRLQIWVEGAEDEEEKSSKCCTKMSLLWQPFGIEKCRWYIPH